MAATRTASAILLLAVLLAMSQTWRREKTAELGETAGGVWNVAPRLLEQAELARVEERALGLQTELMKAHRAHHSPPAAHVANMKHDNEIGQKMDDHRDSTPQFMKQIRSQLSAVRVLQKQAVAAQETAAWAREEEALLKAKLQTEIVRRRDQIGMAQKQRSRVQQEAKREQAAREERTKIQGWRAQQSKAWMKVRSAALVSSLAHVEQQERPEIRKWRQQQAAAWEKERESDLDEKNIDEALHHEASKIKLWRNQQQQATRRWREDASEKSEDDKVLRAQSTEQNLQATAAEHEIKAITAQEMHEWKDARKNEARLRLEAMAKKRALNDLNSFEREDQQITRTLGSDKIASESEAKMRRHRREQEVEWQEAKMKNKAKKVAQQVRSMRQGLETATLERKQAEIEWEHMVKSAIGDGALTQEAERDPSMVHQNLAQYMTKGSAPSPPHLWTTAQEEID